MKTQERGKSVHAHEVMELMLRRGQRYSRESLIEAIHEQMGEGATFHACCAEDLSAGELIDFLWSRGKLRGSEDSFIFDPMDACGGH